MNLIPSELNQRLAHAVRYAADANRFYIVGKAGFWRLVGVGLVVFGLGASIGVCCIGYSFITRNSDNAAILSSTFSKALMEARLQSSHDLPFTNYTIFKNVRYGSGNVVTGWSFDLSDTNRPKSQICYYNENLE